MTRFLHLVAGLWWFLGWLAVLAIVSARRRHELEPDDGWGLFV